MSMSNYAEYGYGMVLTDKEAEEFLEFNKMESCDLYGAVVMDDDYDGKFVNYLKGESEEPYLAVVLPLQKYPTLFSHPYSNVEECVEEIKNNYRDLDFSSVDIGDHIAEYNGSVFC